MGASLAPRLLWRTVIGWSYRDAYRNEPSAAVFGLYRLVALIGIVAVVATMIAINQPKPGSAAAQEPHTPVEKMWGIPAPVVVDRVVTPLSEAPVGLVDQPVLAFQGVDGTRRQPSYLFGLRKFEQKDAVEANGLVGVPPPPGLVALDTADLVVQVNGDRRVPGSIRQKGRLAVVHANADDIILFLHHDLMGEATSVPVHLDNEVGRVQGHQSRRGGTPTSPVTFASTASFCSNLRSPNK